MHQPATPLNKQDAVTSLDDRIEQHKLVRKLKAYLGPLPLIYSCLMIIFTFATWILFYQN